MNEKDRRGYAAIEAMKLGHGGQNYISSVLGCHFQTVMAGINKITNGTETPEKYPYWFLKWCILRYVSGRICQVKLRHLLKMNWNRGRIPLPSEYNRLYHHGRNYLKTLFFTSILSTSLKISTPHFLTIHLPQTLHY